MLQEGFVAFNGEKRHRGFRESSLGGRFKLYFQAFVEVEPPEFRGVFCVRRRFLSSEGKKRERIFNICV